MHTVSVSVDQSKMVVKEVRITNHGNEMLNFTLKKYSVVTFHENEDRFSRFTRKNMAKNYGKSHFKKNLFCHPHPNFTVYFLWLDIFRLVEIWLYDSWYRITSIRKFEISKLFLGYLHRVKSTMCTMSRKQNRVLTQFMQGRPPFFGYLVGTLGSYIIKRLPSICPC